jgi:hypothetical protein
MISIEIPGKFREGAPEGVRAVCQLAAPFAAHG